MTIATANDNSPDQIWAQSLCKKLAKPRDSASSDYSEDLKLLIIFGFTVLLVLWFALMIVGISQ